MRYRCRCVQYISVMACWGGADALFNAPNRGKVEPGVPLHDQPPGRVRDDVDPGVGDRAEQPLGHLMAVLVERRVHRRHDEIEGGKTVVDEIEAAVGSDVALDPGEEAHAAGDAIGGANASGVLERARLVEAVRDRKSVV